MLMKNKYWVIPLVLIAIAGIGLADTWIGSYTGQIDTGQFAGLSRQQLINQMNVVHDGFGVGFGKVTSDFRYNSVESEGDRYFQVQKIFRAELPLKGVMYCLDNFPAGTCFDELVNRETPFNYTIANETYLVEPIVYQLSEEIYAELERLQELQDEINRETDLDNLLDGQEVTIPIFE